MKVLITPREADKYNKTSPEWIALELAEKKQYIIDASIHIFAKWDCGLYISDTDENDDGVLDDVAEGVKMACAYYAECARKGYLFPEEEHGYIVEERNKVGNLEEAIKYDGSPANRLLKADYLMSAYCKKKVSTSTLVRV